MLKSKVTLIGVVIVLVILAAFGALAAIYIYLPVYVEKNLIPDLARKYGISDFQCPVRHIGWRGADLGPLVWGRPDQPALAVDSVRIDYSPRGIYQRRVDQVTVSGLLLAFEGQGGQWSVRGLDFSRLPFAPTAEAPSEGAGQGSRAPLTVDRIRIINTRLELHWQDKIARLPVDVEIDSPDSSGQPWNCRLQAFVFGRPLRLSSTVDLDRKSVSLTFEARQFNPANLHEFFPWPQDLTVAATADVTGRASVAWDPFEITGFHAAATVTDTHVMQGPVGLRNSRDSSGQTTPLDIQIEMSGPDTWQASASPMAVMLPSPLNVSGLSCKIDRGTGLWKAEGQLVVEIEPTGQTAMEAAGIQLMKSLTLPMNFSGQATKENRWRVALNTLPLSSSKNTAKTVRLRAQGLDLSGRTPKLDVSGTIDAADARFEYNLTLPAIAVKGASINGSLASLSVAGKVHLPLAGDRRQASVDYGVRASKAQLHTAEAKLSVADIQIKGLANVGPEETFEISGIIGFNGADLTQGKSGPAAGGINARIPFKWPLEKVAEPGRVTIQHLTANGLDLGGLEATLQQKKNQLVFAGTHVSRLLKGLRFKISANADLLSLPAASGRLETFPSPYLLPPDLDLKRLLPEAEGLKIGGKIDCRGAFSLSPAGPRATIDLSWSGGRVDLTEDHFSMEGIDATLSLADLVAFRSAPRQQLKFSQARLGNIVVENGAVDFQLESARSLFVEKSRFKWCKGSVQIPSVRIVMGDDRYSAVLYCDRINLALLLEQLGAANAEGDGTVNGRIPVHYTKGTIAFDDGFLFSTPGQGGKIRLTGSEVLLAGIPPESVEYGQIDLAREALKDYDYSWVKLNLATEQGTFHLQMQMDGKPAKPLPFALDKQSGRFIRVKTGAQGSVFQGISLDVNFRLPLNKLLRHGKTIGEILKRTQ